MKMQEVRIIAKKMGVKIQRPSKQKLIRAIQLAEGNFDCFGRAVNGECKQMDCIWREDCLS